MMLLAYVVRPERLFLTEKMDCGRDVRHSSTRGRDRCLFGTSPVTCLHSADCQIRPVGDINERTTRRAGLRGVKSQ
jgi:hypothetical protein